MARTLPRYAVYRFREAVRWIKKKEGVSEEGARGKRGGRQTERKRERYSSSSTTTGKGGPSGTNEGEKKKKKNK